MSILTLEVVESFTAKQGGRVVTWEPGQRLYLSVEKAHRVIERVGAKVRMVDQDTGDHVIGTVVQASQTFLLAANKHERIDAAPLREGVGPWIVADLVVVDEGTGLLPGRWLYLRHGPDRRWTHESQTTPYRCPGCQGSQVWWSEHTVLCITCIPPSCPAWRPLWREVAELGVGITADDPRYLPLRDAQDACDEAFRVGDYARFQVGVIRARRAFQGASTVERRLSR